MEKEKMSVKGGTPDLVIVMSHCWKTLDTDFLGIPTAATVSSLHLYLSGHGLFFSLLVEFFLRTFSLRTFATQKHLQMNLSSVIRIRGI